jgi:hypothetical protein
MAHFFGRGYHRVMTKRFTVIDGGDQPLAGTRRDRKNDAVMVLCRVCEADTGVATAVWLPARMGVMERKGVTEGGTDALVCAHCLSRGKVSIAP